MEIDHRGSRIALEHFGAIIGIIAVAAGASEFICGHVVSVGPHAHLGIIAQRGATVVVEEGIAIPGADRVGAGRNGDAFHVRRGAGEPGEHPAVRHGIIKGHGVTVVAGLTWAAKACEEGVIVGRAVYRGSGLGENLEAGIDNLHIVIAAYVAISYHRDD